MSSQGPNDSWCGKASTRGKPVGFNILILALVPLALTQSGCTGLANLANTVTANQVRQLSASASSLNFNNVNVGSSSTLGVTFNNTESSNITVSNVSISGAGYNASGMSTGLILTPGQTTTLNVTFAPAAIGSVTGIVNVSSNASNSTASISLSGTGVQATTYYVDCNAGNDSNPGTSTSAAWATVGKVNNSSFNAGDAILFNKGCTWRAQLVPPSSGSAGNPITFGAYGSGAAPILRGSSLVTSWTLSSGVIYYASVSWSPNMVFQDGVPLTLETNTGAMIAGSYFYDGASRLYVRMTDGSNPSGHTIEASHFPIVTAGPTGGSAGLVDIANQNYITLDGLDIQESNEYGVRVHIANFVTVQNSSFEYGYQNCITPDQGGGGLANSTNLTITSNTFSHCGVNRPRAGGTEGVAIDFAGIQTGIASQNTLIDGYGEGIQVNGGASNITITKNLITNGRFIGIYVSAGYVNGGDTTNVVVSYNKVAMIADNAQPYAIALETGSWIINGVEMYGNLGDCSGHVAAGLLFGFTRTGAIKNATIVNNTIANCYFGIQANGPTVDTSNVFKNNILDATYPWWLADTNESNYSPDYEVLYNSGGSNVVHWVDTDYTLAAFQNAKSKMVHSIEGDPKLTNAAGGDFTLQSSSPTIDAGTNLGSTYQNGLSSSSVWPASVMTLNQNSFGKGWEIGAFVAAVH
jgi:hypothetical protein